MEVPGQKLSGQHGSVSQSSAEDFSHSCDTCIADSQHVEAHGYCLDCREYLCINCFRYHRLTTALKNHRLLDKDNMDKQDVLAKPTDICTEKCSIHRNEVIKFFCLAHEALGCNDCIVMNHRACDIDYIPDKCADIENTEEYSDVMKELDKKIVEVDAVIKKANEKDSLIDANYNQAVLDMDRFHNDIVQHLLDHKRQVVSNADKRKSEVKEKVQKVITSCTAVSSNTNLLRTNIADSKASKQHGQMFIAIKRAKSTLKSNELKETEENLDKADAKYTFERNKALENILTRKDAFGSLIYATAKPSNPSTDSKTRGNPKSVEKSHFPDTHKTKLKDNTQSMGSREVEVPDKLQTKDKANYNISDNSKPMDTSNNKMYDHSKSMNTNKTKMSKMSDHSHTKDTGNIMTDNTKDLPVSKNKCQTEVTKIKQPFSLSPREYITLTTDTDLVICGISGCATLPSQRLLLVDTDNMKLKIINLQRPLQPVVDEKILEAPPRDVATLPRDEAAVTIPNKEKILIVTTDDKLSIKNTINVEGVCRGVTYHQDCLYVVCWSPYCVFVLEMDGRIKYAISLPSKFLSPHYIVFNPVFQLIYVSDIDRHSICSLTVQGETAAVYTDQGFRPVGIEILDDGSLLICNQYNNSICCISGDLKQKWQMTGPSRGGWKPLSICYMHKKVYSGASNSGQLKTFILEK